jgi:hypothetical protein
MECRVELVMEGFRENSKLLGTDEFRELAVIRDRGLRNAASWKILEGDQ